MRGKCGDEVLGEVGRKGVGVGLIDESTLCMSSSDDTLKNEQNTRHSLVISCYLHQVQKACYDLKTNEHTIKILLHKYKNK